MVGGTTFHRTIHEASLGRNEGKRKILSGEEKNEPRRSPTLRAS
jgi:hypothetical protein